MKFSLDDSLGFILGRTALKMKNSFNQALKPHDITVEQWGLLNRLWEKDGVSQKELAEKSCKDQPNITRILDKLEEKGLIRREPDPDDRRAFLIYLTGDGKALKNKLVPIAHQTLERVLTGITAEETDQLKVLLNKIFNNLE